MAGPWQLAYLYVGSRDVAADLRFYRDELGGELVWRFRAGGTEVAAVRLGEGPAVLLADHRPAPSVIQIWAVPDLEDAAAALRAAGWGGPARRVEVPDGPCVLLHDPSGNELALLERTRPGAMERSWADPDSRSAVRDGDATSAA